MQYTKKLKAKEKASEGQAFGNLGIAYNNQCDFHKAIQYHERHLQIAKEVGDKAREGQAYGNLGNANHRLADFHKAIECHECRLQIAKEVGDKAGEGQAYGDLGIPYQSLGDFHKAIEYHECHLQIAKEVGDKTGEGRAYGNLGIAYRGLGDFHKAIKYHECHLQIAKKVGDKAREGGAYGNLGNAYIGLGDFHKAIEYHESRLQIAKEVGDKAGKGEAYGNLGIAYQSLGDFQRAMEYHECHLQIAKEVWDKAGEGGAYGNLGNAYRSLGDFHKAIKYHECHRQIAKEVGDKAGEGRAYGNLGIAYKSLGDFHKAIKYHECHRQIAKEVGDKAGEGRAYGNLGNAYHSLGDFHKAIKYHECHLQIVKEVGDKAGEGGAYGNLGNAYYRLGDFHKAMEYYECRLQIAKEVGDKAGEGGAYGNLGNAYHSLGDFHKAIKYHECHRQIAKEVGDKAGEGQAYGNLGNAYQSLGDFHKAIEYHECHLQIAKELGDKAGEGGAYGNLGNTYFMLNHISKDRGSFLKARDCFSSSFLKLNEIRAHLQFNDEWKISYRDTYNNVYNSLWRLHLSQGEANYALRVAEDGRAQALKDLMEENYGCHEVYSWSHSSVESTGSSARSIPSTTVFIALNEKEIIFWVIRKDEEVTLRRREVRDYVSEEDVRTYLSSLYHTTLLEIGARAGVKIENRSLDESREVGCTTDRAPVNISRPLSSQESLKSFFDLIIAPVADLVHGNDLILVPEGPLCLVPYAALMNPKQEYLCESLKIRFIPSLTTLKLVTDSPADFHNKTGALLVGDPYLEEVLYKGRKLGELPYAKKEVEMIGRILGTAPLIGKMATKGEVLKRLSTVALVHIAAHGKMDTGEIILAPNPAEESHHPEEKDFLLTMADVLEAKLRARLVVLSCCHSAHGEVKAEGVVGISRAFLGAGARSVLVSLWGINDEATFRFMKHFYKGLVKGRRVSEALNQAMKCMRESEEFGEVKYWAPFVLIGDDVTLELNGTDSV